MPVYETLLVEVDNGLARVTVNRPEKLNALSDRVIVDLTEAFRNIQADANIGAAVLTGAGDRAFASGADIAELAAKSTEEAKQTAMRGQALTLLIEHLGKPVVAAVNGYALGGGCEMAMACHFRTASTKAKFGQPEVNLGVITGFGGSQRLLRLVGRGRALELLLTGDMVSADEAFRLGLVNHVVPHDELLPATEGIVRKIMSKGPIAVKYTLEAVYNGEDMPLHRALQFEANLFGTIFGTQDLREGTQAFLEKRKAAFHGK
ncbi:MAG: enoyl-CoA hydratase/isomerase family protein [Planctomycetes bacterium]|nr:enoyl-CoA hydratase/isomerase family protein [Planctomycetota bacterium]